MAKSKEDINLRNRANARRKVLDELGFRDIEKASDKILDTMTPSGIRTALDDVVRNSSVFKHGPIQKLLDAGVKLPNSVEYQVEREEEHKKLMKRQQEREDELRRSYNNLPKIYRDQLADEGYETPQEVEDRVRDIKRELNVIVQEGIDAHHDIVRTDDGTSYRWGTGTNNPVEEEMFRALSQLNDIQMIWLLNMYKNGTLFSDFVSYESKGDGKHTRYLYSARNIIESAKDVGSDGVHPQYGSLSIVGMKAVFKGMRTGFSPKLMYGPRVVSEDGLYDEKTMRELEDSGYIERNF